MADSDDEYVCLALPHQDTLNYMFDAIKDFVAQTVDLVFTANGLEISKSDTADIMQVMMKLTKPCIESAGGLYEYKTSEPAVDVCVNVGLLSNVFKSAVSQGDIVEMRVFASKANYIQIIERNVNTGKCIKSDLKITKSNDRSPDYTALTMYDSCITMESVEFYDNIKKLCITESGTVRFYCSSGEGTADHVMSLSTSGFIADAALTIRLLDSTDALNLLQSREDSKTTVAADDTIMTIDPMQSSSMEKRVSCVKRGSALFCKERTTRIRVDEDFPLSFVKRVAQAKAVAKYISILTSGQKSVSNQVITLSFDTEIGYLRFMLASKEKNAEVRSSVPQPVFVMDSLSERVNDACKEKCNAIKRKRTRRVWSHKGITTAASAATAATAAPKRRKYARKSKAAEPTATDEIKPKKPKKAKKTDDGGNDRVDALDPTKQTTIKVENGIPRVGPPDVAAAATTTRDRNIRRLTEILQQKTTTTLL